MQSTLLPPRRGPALVLRVSFLLAALSICGASNSALSQPATSLIVRPYSSNSRPWTRWWWFASIITEKDIRWNLDWLKANGFGGVEIAWVYPLNRMQRDTVHYTPRQEWLSPEWSRIVQYAKSYADGIGLGCDVTFGTLWPFGDAKVGRQDATRRWGDTSWRQEITASWEYPRKGYVIDHLNRGALRKYARRIMAALPKDNGKIGASYFMDSWEVETRQLWTKGFEKDFKRRFRYDITPFMDSIYAQKHAHVRYDYMSLLSDKVIRFYRDFTRLVHGNGALSRVQCSGAPCDIISAYASVDVPESEAMLYEPEYSRFVASAAALSRKQVVTSETFTCLYGWPRDHIGEEQTADLKLVADALFSNGVNHIFWHGKPFNPHGVDSVKFYASVHVGSSGALSDEIPAFNTYMETVSSWLKRGRPYCDVAVYAPVEDSWMAGELPREKQLIWAWGAYEFRSVYQPEELRGYHPLWINREFLEKASWNGNRLVVGDCDFSRLYIDVEFLDLAALRRIVQLAVSGLPVVLKRLPRQPGRNASLLYPGLLRKLLSLTCVKRSMPSTSDVEPLVEGERLPDFWCKRDSEGYSIFFANPASRRLTFPIGYGQGLDQTTDSIGVTLHIDGESIPLMLEFKPYQSLLVRIDLDHRITFPDIWFMPKTPVVQPRPKVERERWELPR